jgi:hypothetical protein
MAAGEDELEPLVGNRGLVHIVLSEFLHVEQAELRLERAIAADAVDGAVACRRQEPRSRIRGSTFARPTLGRDRERLLGGLLGEVEVAEEADEAREDTSPFVAEDLLEDLKPP